MWFKWLVGKKVGGNRERIGLGGKTNLLVSRVLSVGMEEEKGYRIEIIMFKVGLVI